MKITWFRHSHENRNDLLRFGLMRKHYGREIKYVEKSIDRLAEGGFRQTIASYPDLRHQSFLLIEHGGRRVRCLVDSEDSFALFSPLIAEVDFCFCAGYNADLFERKQFVQAYNWQTDIDLAWYRRTLEEKIEQLGQHFYKVKRFVPIGPNQGGVVTNTYWQQRYKNLLSKIDRLSDGGDRFRDVYKAFELREAQLLSLREQKLQYDVVLNDSLWGWPQHRLNLHLQLQRLSEEGRKIHSVLNWTEPGVCDGSLHQPLDPSLFPLRTAVIDGGYETMLAQSRLAVFACGFHWGWRNIMMLALKAGVPVLTDRLLTEPYFDMAEFALTQSEDHQWNSVETELQSIDEEKWQLQKQQNQQIYDRYMSPDAVVEYFLKSVC